MSTRLAAFTIVQDDIVFLRKWLQHYTAGCDAVYVLDHASRDSAAVARLCAEASATRIHLDWPVTCDSVWLARVMTEFQRFLLTNWSTVVFAPVDALLLGVRADPWEILRGCHDVFVQAERRDVVQWTPAALPPLQLELPWLPQRPGWLAAGARIAAARLPVHWRPDLTGGYNVTAAQPNPQLVQAHFHRADLQLCLQRHRERAARRWPEQVDPRWLPSRICEPEQLELWMHSKPLELRTLGDFEPMSWSELQPFGV